MTKRGYELVGWLNRRRVTTKLLDDSASIQAQVTIDKRGMIRRNGDAANSCKPSKPSWLDASQHSLSITQTDFGGIGDQWANIFCCGRCHEFGFEWGTSFRLRKCMFIFEFSRIATGVKGNVPVG